jgi:hypothetical protein
MTANNNIMATTPSSQLNYSRMIFMIYDFISDGICYHRFILITAEAEAKSLLVCAAITFYSLKIKDCTYV